MEELIKFKDGSTKDGYSDTMTVFSNRNSAMVEVYSEWRCISNEFYLDIDEVKQLRDALNKHLEQHGQSND